MQLQSREFVALFAAAALLAAPLSASAAPLEKPKTEAAEVFLGPAVIGSNYKVKPRVRSDGLMRIFDVETNYGQFEFDGVEFTKMRLRELDAVTALEKMSQSDEFVKALGNAAIAPVKFGADLITNPVGTINRSLSGVGNMLDRASAGLNNQRADRDTLADSLLGVSDTERQLAVELSVDPYTDFPPLAEKLRQVASAMASGGLPVKAGIALIPGGVGIAISSVSSVTNARDTLASKTAAQVIAESHETLKSLDVPDESIDELLNNRNYTPSDLLLMSRALKEIGAQNTVVFVNSAAAQGSTRDVAFYERRLAQLMAARSKTVGGIASFISVAGQPVAIRRSGDTVAILGLDDLAWTAVPERAFNTATTELKRKRPGDHPTLATTGAVTPMARREIEKLGWKVVKIEPLPTINGVNR
jgi:hypothetical protein